MLDLKRRWRERRPPAGWCRRKRSGQFGGLRHEAIDFAALGQAAVGTGNLAIPLVKRLAVQGSKPEIRGCALRSLGATARTPSTPTGAPAARALDAAETLLEQLLAATGSPGRSLSRYRDAGRRLDQHALPVTLA